MYDCPHGGTTEIVGVETRGVRGETENLGTCGEDKEQGKVPPCNRPRCLRALEPGWEPGSLHGGRRKSPDTCKSRKRARITR